MKKTAKFREDLPKLYIKIKKKLISKSEIAKTYGISHTIVGNIVRDYEQNLKSKSIENDLQFSATPITKKNEYVIKEKAKFKAMKEIIQEQLESYNIDRCCKDGSKVITKNKSKYISKTVAILYPEAKNLDRLDIRALVR